MKSCAKSICDLNCFPTFYDVSRAARFGIEPPQLQTWLLEVITSHLGSTASLSQIEKFCRTLHLADLVLARVCVLGFAAAWEELISTHGAAILRAAFRIADEMRARELANSLWTDLYCCPSKLGSYSGRGPLENWLKAALYQSNTNLYRSERRFVTLEESLCPVCTELAPRDLAQAEIEMLVQRSLRSVLKDISNEDRFLLAAYFLDGRNLMQISAVLRVHESTVSRRIAKVLKQLRRAVSQQLRASGLTTKLTISVDPDFDLRRELS